MSAHEDFTSHHPTNHPSDFSFGLTAAAVSTVVALWPLLHRRPVRLWALVLACAWLSVACAKPGLLRPANRAWMQLGLGINRLMTPILSGVFFFAVVTPLACVFRLSGRDTLRLRPDPEVPTYWIERRPAGPPAQSMEQQF